MDGELETLEGVLHLLVEVYFLQRQREILVGHFGALQDGFDEHPHAAVFVVDDADEVAAGGEVAADGFVLQHFAGEPDGGNGGFDFVGHVVDEVGLHLVEFALDGDGADGEDEEGRDENDHEDAEDGVFVGVAGEDDGGGGEDEDEVEVFVGDDAVGVEDVFVGGVAHFGRVAGIAAVVEGVAFGFEDADGGFDVHSVDYEFFPDERVEQGEVEFGGVDGVVVDEVAILFVGVVDGVHEAVAGAEEGVVLREDAFFLRGEVGLGQYGGAVLGGDAEADAAFVVKEFAVVADDVLHLFVHVVDAAVLQDAVALFLRHVVFYFHLVELGEDFVDGVVDADVEKVVAHLGGFPHLGDLDDYEGDGRDGEKGGQKDEKTTFHVHLLNIWCNVVCEKKFSLCLFLRKKSYFCTP